MYNNNFKAPEVREMPEIAQNFAEQLKTEGYIPLVSAFQSDTGLRIMLYSTTVTHLSVSHPDRMPTIEELHWARKTFVSDFQKMALFFDHDKEITNTLTMFEIFIIDEKP